MGVVASIKSVGDVLGRELCIPDFQRAYRWRNANVMQLLDDIRISMETGKDEYRIGSVILYPNDENKYEIVDGQQRLTTILLVEVTAGNNFGGNALTSLRYSTGSLAAIRDNAKCVDEWLSDKTAEWRSRFVSYLLENCKFVEIVVDDLSEAFQMFDTQNGRGKSLEPYNLLKAYHIRAMEQNSQEEKIKCDQEWEDATQYDATPDDENDPNVDILKQLFSEQLFKSRLWCRGEICRDDGEARVFSRNEIDEFKGFTIDKNHPIAFPFQNPFLLRYMTNKFYQNVLSGTVGTKARLEAGETDKVNPFVNINQTVINGNAFFEYIQTYVELYKKMFIELGSYQLFEFKKFFYLHCLVYDPSGEDRWNKARCFSSSFRHTDSQSRRSGDTYLREVYKSLCFVLLDKFGEKVFNKYYKPLYRLVYQLRLKNSAVRYQSAMTTPAEYFKIISRAKTGIDLLAIERCAGELQKAEFRNEDKLKNMALVKFIKEGR